MPTSPRSAAILVAAGRGLRAGSGGPKQYRVICGQSVIFRAMQPFCNHPQVFAVQPVLNPDDTAVFNEAVSALRYQPPAHGGATRQASVHAGLEALASVKRDVVVIHDAARPFVSAALISRAIEAALRTGAAIPAMPIADTVKQVSESGDVEATPERARLRIAQTPQAFRYDVILDAHRRAAREGRRDFTDDAAIAEWAGLTVATFACRTHAAFSPIPTAMSACMRWSTPSSARWPTAISARTFRRATRNGRGPPPTAS